MHNFSTLILASRPGDRRILLFGLLSTLFFIAVFALRPTLMQTVDLKNYDLLLRNFPDNCSSSNLVIVDLDEKSLRQYGQWPWPRYQVARLFDRIAALKPSVISLDLVFAEPDRTSLGQLLQNIGAASQLKIAVETLPDELCDNDLLLSQTFARAPFVLGNKFHFNSFEKSSEECTLHPVRIASMQSHTGEEQILSGIPESSGVLCNLPTLSKRVTASGFLNFAPDQDGMLRRLPLLIVHSGELYASLALATVMKLKQVETLVLKRDGKTLQSVNYKGTSVPVDQYGQLLIKFHGPKKSYHYISAADIMEGKVMSAQLKGRIVFVGTSADGLKELRTSPFDPILPGVEVHATAVDNLLNSDFISVPGWSNGLILLLTLVMGFILTLLISFSGATVSFIVMVLFIGGLWITTQQLFFSMSLFVGTAFPIASVLCNYIFLTLLRYRLEERRMVSGLKELLLTQEITIESMANLAEYRDKETGGHIKRTMIYVKLLAQHIRQYDKYRDFLSDTNIELLYKSAPLHDIGKVGIPDNILLKPGKLTEEEFEIMKLHTTIGRDVIDSSVRKLGKKSFLTIAVEIAHSHQEKWDGSGYPQGLRGDEIPISGRLMALADVYDALVSKRVYKPPFPHARAVDIIREGRGSHFDPDLVDAFLEIHEEFRAVAIRFADSQEERDILEKDSSVLD